MIASTLRERFMSPPAEYRPAPFLVMNDDYDDAAAEARLTQVLEGFQRVGYGGAFIHPRPGLITEYLSPRWFAMVRHIVAECRRLGLTPYLYDENSYPSGVGGGHVPARVPEARTQYVTPLFGSRHDDLPASHLALYRWEGTAPGALVTPAQLAAGEPWVAFVLRSMQPTPWHGETACPSLLDPRTVEAFLASTHEAYRRELGDLWSAVPAIFTDEPHLPAEGHGPWSPGLHLTPYVLGQFHRRCGYDLRPYLASLYYDVGDYRRIRFDLYDLMHQLWLENWALPLESWCTTHHIALTGHYLEHDWPCPYATPGQVHLLAHMHWPGTDMLETFLLTGHASFDIQNFAPAADGMEPHGLLYLRQCHSVANQLRKERVLNESWGAGGHDSTPADWARIGRWLIVHGVNLFVPHLSHTTIRGTRKSDHPQTFSDHSPWYEYLAPLNDELSRLCWLSNQGVAEQRLLVLDPQTTGYCVSRKADCLVQEAGTQSASTPASASLFERALASVSGIQREMSHLAQALSDRQVDYDLGDEYILEEFGRIDNGVIIVGQQSYRLVLWPACLTNLRQQTVAMLDAYLASGGQIYGIDPGDLTVDGRPSTLLVRYRTACRWFPDATTLLAAVEQTLPPRLRLTQVRGSGVAHMRRVVPEGELFLIVNSSAQVLDSSCELETKQRAAYELDPLSGRCYRLPHEVIDGGVRVSLMVQARAATVLWLGPAGLPCDPRPDALLPSRDGERLALRTVQRLGPNVLPVDWCQLELNGRRTPSELVYAANKRLWEAHGFETNGWMATIQYRDQILARNRSMAAESGGTVLYEVEIAPDLDPSTIRLVIETPELWRVAVNGEIVDATLGERWLDRHMRALPVGAALRSGTNVVALEGRPFDVRREIDQIVLLGDFACAPGSPGFRLVRAEALGLGPWRDQGHPFYDREVAYTFDLPPGQGCGVLSLEPEEWAGSYLLVEYAGRRLAQLHEPPYAVALERGEGETVTVRIVGLPKNLLGPWHDRSRPRKRAWIGMWYGATVPTDPQPGKNYDLLDLGLFAAPRWQWAEGR